VNKLVTLQKKRLIKSSFDFQELEKTLHSFGLKTKLKIEVSQLNFKNNALIEEFLEKLKITSRLIKIFTYLC